MTEPSINPPEPSRAALAIQSEREALLCALEKLQGAVSKAYALVEEGLLSYGMTDDVARAIAEVDFRAFCDNEFERGRDE